MSVILSGLTLFSYAEVYLDAAERLASVETKEYREGDWNIFSMPLLFLFRHYLELGLKACIYMKKEIEVYKVVSQPDTSQEELLRAQETMGEKLKCTHDLSEIVGDLKKCFSDRRGLFSESVQNYLKHLSNYDKKSDVFRYPFDTKGDWLLPDQPIIPMSEIKKMIKETSREINSIAKELIENLHRAEEEWQSRRKYQEVS